MPLITTIQDLKVIYKSRVPKMFYDYCESGSWTEQTFRDNVTDFSKIRLRQRVAIDMSKRSIKTKMLGQDVSMPVALARIEWSPLSVPVGYCLARGVNATTNTEWHPES